MGGFKNSGQAEYLQRQVTICIKCNKIHHLIIFHETNTALSKASNRTDRDIPFVRHQCHIPTIISAEQPKSYLPLSQYLAPKPHQKYIRLRYVLMVTTMKRTTTRGGLNNPGNKSRLHQNSKPQTWSPNTHPPGRGKDQILKMPSRRK